MVHASKSGVLVRHMGGCHCGSVRFQVMAPASLNVMDCNCSLCVKKQCKHFVVPMSQFKLLSGHDALTTYTFNTHKAKHTFCSTCGVQPFFIPNTCAESFGIAPHCLDEGTVKKVSFVKQDGRKAEKGTQGKDKDKK